MGSNPTGGIDVCCECCVLWGRGLCDELVTRPDESYRWWCVVVCDLETSRMRRPWPGLGRRAIGGGGGKRPKCATVGTSGTAKYFEGNKSFLCWERSETTGVSNSRRVIGWSAGSLHTISYQRKQESNGIDRTLEGKAIGNFAAVVARWVISVHRVDGKINMVLTDHPSV
jgi:hypothetical protein